MPGQYAVPRAVGLAVSALAVGVALIIYFLTASSSSSSSSSHRSTAGNTPQQAVARFLESGKTNDIPKMDEELCRADIARGGMAAASGIGKDRVLTYVVGDVQLNGDSASVAVTVTATDVKQPTTTRLPVLKEGGSWKVCLSRISGSGSTQSGAP